VTFSKFINIPWFKSAIWHNISTLRNSHTIKINKSKKFIAETAILNFQFCGEAPIFGKGYSYRRNGLKPKTLIKMFTENIENAQTGINHKLRGWR